MTATSKTTREVLAGYVSGATVELAKVREKDGAIKLGSHTSFVSRDFSDFESILNLYFKRHKGEISQACFGVAGPVIDNEVHTTNLPWHIHGSDIEKRFFIPKVQLLNDIVAFGHGLPTLDKDRFYTLNEGTSVASGNIGLMAIGAGLGEAIVYVTDGRHHPYASEGGHAGFAPGNQQETELWQHIYAEHGYVEVEDVLSLRGLERIYNFLVDSDGTSLPGWLEKASDRSSAIIEKALSGKDEYATRVLDIFIDCMASEAANLALKGMTLGGVYLGGLIGPQIITMLDNGRFMERFVRRGKMESVLTRIPIGVVIEEKTALLGAAAVSLRM